MTPEERRAAALEALQGAHPHKPKKRVQRRMEMVPRKHRVTSKEWRVCARKKAYSRRMAQALVGRVWMARQVKVRAYLCPFCGKYHLTKRFFKPGDDNGSAD